MDHSLSLEPNSNEIVKTNSSCASIFVQEVPRINFTKFDMVTIGTLANMQNPSNCHHPFLFSKCIQNHSKPEHLSYGELLHFTSFQSIPCSYFSEMCNCSKYLKYKLFHYRHYIAFNQNANKTFSKFTTNCMVSF